MPVSVTLAAGAVGLSIPLLWWVVSSARQPAAHAVAKNLSLGNVIPDLRKARLQESARERAVAPAMAGLAARARKVTPAGLVESLEAKIQLAGAQGEWGIERVLAMKFLGGAIGVVFGLLVFLSGPSALTFLLVVLVTGMGYFGPDAILASRVESRQMQIQNELADTLDQITISVEAGLGFEAAMARVGQTGTGPLAFELSRTLQDIQLGVSRKEALKKLVERTEVEDLRRFVHAISQAEGYGIPIAQVLRVQSLEMRDKRKQRAEEKAMKVPVKIVFPVVLCIFPTLFIVTMGPAVIKLIRDWPS